MSARLLSFEELRAAAAASHFQVKEFARLLKVEVRTLERQFVVAFGCSPDEWLAQQRMAEAARLLQRGFNAKEVAAEIAYHHPSSFFREFRRRHGCTPSQFMEARPAACVSRASAALSQTATTLSQTATSPALPVGASL